MRIREAVLSGDAALYRQTIVTSSLLTPELNAFVHRHCKSHSGVIRWKPEPKGVLSCVAVQVAIRDLLNSVKPTISLSMQGLRAALWPAPVRASLHRILTPFPPVCSAQVQQLFERLPAAVASEAANSRMEFFKKKVWPSLKESNTPGQLIFVSSYFDFVRLRNFLLKVRGTVWVFDE